MGVGLGIGVGEGVGEGRGVGVGIVGSAVGEATVGEPVSTAISCCSDVFPQEIAIQEMVNRSGASKIAGKTVSFLTSGGFILTEG